MRRIRLGPILPSALVLALCAPAPALAADVITHYGGTGVSNGTLGATALTHDFDLPESGVVDADGNLYQPDRNTNRVVRIAPDGALTSIAGNGTQGVPTPGPATSSPLGGPLGLTLDGQGNLYMANAARTMVSKVTPDGQLSNVAGNGTSGAITLGPAATSQVGSVQQVAVDASGNLLVADYSNRAVLKITPQGVLSRFAGTGVSGPATPGPAASSRLRNPAGVVVDASGNVYISDQGNNQIYKVNPQGDLSIFAGTGATSAAVPGPAVSTPIGQPYGLALDAVGSIYFSSLDFTTFNTRVEKITADGTLSHFAGNNLTGTTVFGGSPTGTPLGFVAGVTAAPDGVVYVSDGDTNTIDRVGPTEPAPPRSLAVTPATGTLALSFKRPTSFGAAPLTGYEASTDGGSTWTTITAAAGAGTALTATLSGLTRGRAYAVAVRAVNGSGPSPRSAVVPTETLPATDAPASAPAVPDSTVAARLPGAPTRLTARGTERALLLSFRAPAATGTAPVGSYEVQLGGGRWRPLATEGTGRLTAKVTGLKAGAEYSMRVRAVSAVGVGAASRSATATTDWFRDPLSRAERSKLIPIPRQPGTFTFGKLRKTRAYARSFDATPAISIPDLRRRPLALGQAATLSGKGLFEFDRDRLTDEGRREVRLLVASLEASKSVTCEGYTDYAGDRAHELELSRGRARAVCTALKAYGAKVATRTAGYGPRRPVVVGGTAQSREANRRVVVLVTG